MIALSDRGGLPAAEVDLSELPAAYAGKVDFQKDVLPIFEASCFRCHGPEKPRSGFRLDNRQSALAGGDQGTAILPGHGADSPLIHYVARLVRDLEMPPTGKGDPLRPYEIGVLRAWIDQGADYGGRDLPERARLSFELTGGAGYLDVDGDAAKFRQNSRLNDGWTGGVSEFTAQGPLDERTDFRLDGRVLFGQDDARLQFEVRREDWGSVSGGVSTRRSWYDDSGGYHPDFTPPLFELGQDLYVDTGRAWIDLELDRGELPWVRLGYEFQFREGTMSTTQWGNVSPPIRNVYPSVKEVDEQTHIFKFDIAKELDGWRLENDLRVEWHAQGNRRVNVTAFNSAKTGPEKYTEVREGYEHTQGANTFTAEKWIRDWFMIGGGYLYSWLDGGATFDQSNTLTPNAALPPAVGFSAFGLFTDRFYQSTSILVDREAHVGGVTTKLGPWQEVLLYGGVQGDWSRQSGFSAVNQRFGSPTATVFPNSIWSDLNRQLFEERAGLRFTGLPFSSLYAEGRWRQEEIGQAENELFNGFSTLTRGTDATTDGRQYRFGGSTSPWQPVLLSGHYQMSRQRNDYEPTAGDLSDGPAGFGYPNFIAGRRIDGDQLEGSVVTRLAANVKATFKYQREQTDYETTHRALFTGLPGASLEAGEQEADIFSAGLYWTLWSRLGLNFSGSLADTRLNTFANNAASVVPYEGQVWSVLASVLWTIDDRTDVNATYVWSSADYRQENFAAGLPLGIDYQWHQLRAGLNRRLNEQLSVGLLYFFQQYDEPTAGGFNDYTANGVFASLTWRWAE